MTKKISVLSFIVGMALVVFLGLNTVSVQAAQDCGKFYQAKWLNSGRNGYTSVQNLSSGNVPTPGRGFVSAGNINDIERAVGNYSLNSIASQTEWVIGNYLYQAFWGGTTPSTQRGYTRKVPIKNCTIQWNKADSFSSPTKVQNLTGFQRTETVRAQDAIVVGNSLYNTYALGSKVWSAKVQIVNGQPQFSKARYQNVTNKYKCPGRSNGLLVAMDSYFDVEGGKRILRQGIWCSDAYGISTLYRRQLNVDGSGQTPINNNVSWSNTGVRQNNITTTSVWQISDYLDVSGE